MYGTYPALNRPFSVSAHMLLMEVNMFAENMGHDTVDSIHLPATVLCVDPQAYPTARQILLDMDFDPERLRRRAEGAFIGFFKMPEKRYQTPAYKRMLRLSAVFAELRVGANPTDNTSITSSDLVVAALESGSEKLESLLTFNYEQVIERVLAGY